MGAFRFPDGRGSRQRLLRHMRITKETYKKLYIYCNHIRRERNDG